MRTRVPALRLPALFFAESHSFAWRCESTDGPSPSVVIFQASYKIKCSLKEYAALEAYAASRKKSVDAVINDISVAAANAAIKNAPAK